MSAPTVCSHLGTVEDPASWINRPSGGNYCHRVTPPGAVSEEHQRQTCITAAFNACPVYQSGAAGRLPEGIFDEAPPRRPGALLLITLLVVLLAAGAVWWFLF